MRFESTGLKGQNNLANVNVGARLVNLRVVMVEMSSGYPSLGLDAIAGISTSDGAGRCAIISYDPKADTLVCVELGTAGSDNAFINGGKLVTKNSLSILASDYQRDNARRDVVFSGNAVAGVPFLHDICPAAFSCRDVCCVVCCNEKRRGWTGR